MNVATEPSPIGHESALRLGFHHGLGDCVHYAHVLELYRRRGHRVLLSVESNKTGLWSLLGVPHVVDRSFGNPWSYPAEWGNAAAPLELANKVAHNAARHRPTLGSAQEIWSELVGVRLSIRESIPAWAWAEAMAFVAALPRPLAIVHAQGNTSAAKKNLSAATTVALQQRLVASGFGVVVADWDRRSAVVDSPGVRCLHLRWAHTPMAVFAALLFLADAMIGIDSGPLHLATVTDVPSLGIWLRHDVRHCSLPSPRSWHRVPDATVRAATAEQREAWHMIPYSAAIEPGVDRIVGVVGEMLDRTRTPERLGLPIALDAASCAGSYRYVREGYDVRNLDLLPNGFVGEGRAACEHRWAAYTFRDARYLAVFGEDQAPTFQVEARDDGAWSNGSWLHDERMPVTLLRGARRLSDPNPVTGQQKLANMQSFLRDAPAGDVVEVGVYEGGSLAWLASRFPWRRFLGFDTFAGLPAPTPRDNHHRVGEFAADFANVQRRLAELHNVSLHRGVFPGSAGALRGPLALVHVDVDLFEGTLASLRHVAPLMAPGGRVYCDDALWQDCEGATLAVCAFASETGRPFRLDPALHVYFQF
ncbi:MAG: TylF/MycF/NovP-related O-methyltransferase [Planctomycetota bacterium]